MNKIELKRKILPVIIINIIMLATFLINMYFKNKNDTFMSNRDKIVKVIKDANSSGHDFVADKIMREMKILVPGNDEHFMWSQWIGKNLFLFLFILAIIFGANDFTSQQNDKTIYLSMNYVTRDKFYLSKTVISVAYIGLSVIFAGLITTIGTLGAHLNIAIYKIWIVMLQMFISTCTVYILAAFISPMLTHHFKRIFIILIILLAMVGSVFSPTWFAYATGMDVLIFNNVFWIYSAAGVIINIGLFLLKKQLFIRSEIY